LYSPHDRITSCSPEPRHRIPIQSATAPEHPAWDMYWTSDWLSKIYPSGLRR
jgi:hypothetical protein